MNEYTKNLNKIEFVITYACTGRCRHCSEGDHSAHGEHIDPDVAADAVRKIAANYSIGTVMTFGGEPLLFPDVVYKIHSAARDMDVKKRQIITNGYFSKDPARIGAVADGIAECGVNDVLLSVDAFHQETIPLDTVKAFAAAVKDRRVPLRLHPAWLVSSDNDNPYNLKTRQILAEFQDLDIAVNDGNVIFPEGNALKHLGEYFTSERPPNPYADDPKDVRCVSFDPFGSVLTGNVYRRDIIDILRNYEP